MRITLRRSIALTMAAVTLASSTACFGSFNATRKVWGFNRDASKNKFVQELVFLGMNVVPVYGVAAFLDAVVFNTAEFWTGENPLKMASRTKIDGRQAVETAVRDNNGVRMLEVRGFVADSLTFTTTVTPVRGTDQTAFSTVFSDGRVVTRVIAVDPDGNPYVLRSHDTQR